MVRLREAMNKKGPNANFKAVLRAGPIYIAYGIIVLCTLACSQIESPSESTTSVASEVATNHECPESRAQICTREYRPVCAIRDNGVRCVTTPCPSTEWVTYPNACSACADASVYSYAPGACPNTDPDTTGP